MEENVQADTSLANHPGMRTLSLLLRMLVGTVFLVFGIEKLNALTIFGGSIAAYQLVPSELANILAILFAWTEVVVGVLLFAGAAIRGSALVAGSMLALFIVVISIALARGLEIDCGCGAVPEPLGPQKLLEDIGLLVASIFLIYFPKSYFMIGDVLGDRGG